MDHRCSRRSFMGTAAGAAVSGGLLFGRKSPTARARENVAQDQPAGQQSVVSLIQGENRRKMVDKKRGLRNGDWHTSFGKLASPEKALIWLPSTTRLKDSILFLLSGGEGLNRCFVI